MSAADALHNPGKLKLILMSGELSERKDIPVRNGWGITKHLARAAEIFADYLAVEWQYRCVHQKVHEIVSFNCCWTDSGR